MSTRDVLFRIYLLAVFTFVFAPIVTSMIFSFNSDRFPTVPLGEFTTHWYETAFSRPEVWTAFQNSLIVALCAAILSTARNRALRARGLQMREPPHLRTLAADRGGRYSKKYEGTCL